MINHFGLFLFYCESQSADKNFHFRRSARTPAGQPLLIWDEILWFVPFKLCGVKYFDHLFYSYHKQMYFSFSYQVAQTELRLNSTYVNIYITWLYLGTIHERSFPYFSVFNLPPPLLFSSSSIKKQEVGNAGCLDMKWHF